MTKLVDQFGTKYFAAHYAGEVSKFLSTVNEVDLAGARICRDVMKYITAAAYTGVEVHDSEDQEREEYFAENRRRRELQKNSPRATPLPLPTCVDDVVQTVKALDPNKTYLLADGSRVISQAFLFLAQAARPEIKVDLGNYVGDFLAFVYDNLYPNDHRWSEFYVLVGSTFVIEKPLPGEYNLFIHDNVAIPTDLGQKNLFRLPEWVPCIDRVSAILDKSLKPRNRKIKDYL